MKRGLVVAITLVVSACARSGGAATPDLYAVCWHSADAATVNLVIGNGWARPSEKDGPFHVPLDRAPLVSWDPADGDEDAIGIIERLGSDRPRLTREYEQWVVMSRSDDRMLLGGITPDGSLGAMVYATPSEDGGWTRRFAREVRCGIAVGDSGSWAEARAWHLEPKVELRRSDSELAIRFYEGCPDDTAGWEIVPVVFTNDEVVMITMTVTPPANGEPQYCELGSAFSWRDATVDVGEPVGDRLLIDGSKFPMQLRSWPPLLPSF